MTGTIRLYGRLMRFVALAIGSLVSSVFLYAVALALVDRSSFDRLMSDYLLNGRIELAFGPFALLALGLIGLANLVLMGAGLYSVWRIGGVFARGEVLALESGRWLRRLGAVLIAGAASTVLSRTLSVALATTVPDGGQLLMIGLGTSEAFLLLAALMMLVLGHVMVLATEIDVENRAFV